MATRYLSRALLSTTKPLSFLLSHSYTTAASSAAVIPKSSFIFRLRPLIAAVSTSNVRRFAPAMSIRGFATRKTSSSPDDPNQNWSNRPPKETILLEGCDYEHWLVVMEKPEPDLTRDEIIDSYIKTLAMVLGSEEEARMKIYSVSTKHYYAFGALVPEELTIKIKKLPKVTMVLADSYLYVENKDYGGEPFINGQAVPYDPKYHAEWVRNSAGYNDRNRRREPRNHRPHKHDRSLSKEMMEDAIVENDVEINNQSEAAGDKRKSQGKLRSEVWQHFTKIVKEDGKCDKCQCNHCQKLFNYSSRNGTTTHLLCHITDGKCPIFKKENSEITISDNSLSQNSNTNAGLLPWQSDNPSSAQQCTDDEVELVPNLESQPLDDPTPLLSSSRSSELPVKSAWMNEFRSCVDKLVQLVNGKLPAAGAVGAGPDYSISAALRFLNEMEDIPQSSEMYLDAIEILQDAGERECFICLPPEPRRRWMQRVLHRRHPSRYSV